MKNVIPYLLRQSQQSSQQSRQSSELFYYKVKELFNDSFQEKNEMTMNIKK